MFPLFRKGLLRNSRAVLSGKGAPPRKSSGERRRRPGRTTWQSWSTRLRSSTGSRLADLKDWTCIHSIWIGQLLHSQVINIKYMVTTMAYHLSWDSASEFRQKWGTPPFQQLRAQTQQSLKRVLVFWSLISLRIGLSIYLSSLKVLTEDHRVVKFRFGKGSHSVPFEWEMQVGDISGERRWSEGHKGCRPVLKDFFG